MCVNFCFCPTKNVVKLVVVVVAVIAVNPSAAECFADPHFVPRNDHEASAYHRAS